MQQTLRENFIKIPQLPQRQDSVTEQLRDLFSVANRLGMYDAATHIQLHLRPNGANQK